MTAPFGIILAGGQARRMGGGAAGARTLLSLVASARRRALLGRAVLELDAGAVLPLVAPWALRGR